MFNSIYFTQNGKTYNMPDYFSHVIIADRILEKLDKQHRSLIDDRYLYLLGAQGGDVFFAYNLKLNKTNLGRRLHTIPADKLFTELDCTNPSYCAGYATHYALDCTLHPAIYAFENEKKSPVAHFNFESDLGLYISRKYATPRKILPREAVIGATFTVYDCIKKVDDSITLTGIERCLKRHFTYTKYIYKNKKQTYKYDYDYSSLAGSISDAIDLGVKAVKCVLNRDIAAEIFDKQFLQK